MQLTESWHSVCDWASPSGFCRVRWLKLKALLREANQSAVTF